MRGCYSSSCYKLPPVGICCCRRFSSFSPAPPLCPPIDYQYPHLSFSCPTRSVRTNTYCAVNAYSTHIMCSSTPFSSKEKTPPNLSLREKNIKFLVYSLPRAPERLGGTIPDQYHLRKCTTACSVNPSRFSLGKGK